MKNLFYLLRTPDISKKDENFILDLKNKNRRLIYVNVVQGIYLLLLITSKGGSLFPNTIYSNTICSLSSFDIVKQRFPT